MLSSTREQVRKDHPDVWIAVHEGDSLDGELVDVTRAYSDARAQRGDGFYPLLSIRTADGVTLKFHAFSAVSYNEVMDWQPVPGERMRITYLGEASKAKPGQNVAKLYKISMPDRDPRERAKSVYSTLGADRALASASRQLQADLDATEEPETRF